MIPQILVVEDDAPTRAALTDALRIAGYAVTAVASGEAALLSLEDVPYDAVVTDLSLGEVSGLDLLHRIRATRPETVVIVVTGYGTVDTAVEAVRGGAADFLTKPVDLDRLELSLARGLSQRRLEEENRNLRSRLQERYSIGGMVGRSPLIRRLADDLHRFAEVDASVLVTGESGVGKELVVEAIHNHSARADAPLIRVNLPALAEGVFESELFGHERGAFTGASRARKGRFEAASGGTLFLDEIAELRPESQAKLLRVLESGAFERVGSSTPIRCDVRVVAATNRDLAAEVRAGRFREDLFYRLAVLQVQVPPLRDRPDDIPLLAQHFLERMATRHNRKVKGIEPAALDALAAWGWPGNVRELRNCIESAVVLARGSRITMADLPPHFAGQERTRCVVVEVGRPLEEIERQVILATLEAFNGNRTEAAQTLGIGVRTLYRRLEAWAAEE